MEPVSIASVTLASILASLSVSSEPVSQAVITTHSSPAIAGQWEFDLDSVNAMVDKTEQSAKPLSAVNIVEPKVTSESLDGVLTQSESSVSTISPMTSDNKMSKLAAVNTININSQCREIYNFGEDNNMRTASGKEWTYGRYLVSHVEEGLPIIAIKTVYDNNGMDCSGNQVDQTGETLIAFLNHNGNQMQWCADPEGKECFMNFNKVLP